MLFGVGRRFTGAAKALTFGAAAGLGYGLQAAVTKTFVTELGGGVLGLLSSWSVYVLILSAVSGFGCSNQPSRPASWLRPWRRAAR